MIVRLLVPARHWHSLLGCPLSGGLMRFVWDESHQEEKVIMYNTSCQSYLYLFSCLCTLLWGKRERIEGDVGDDIERIIFWFAVPSQPRNVTAAPNALRSLLIEWQVPEITNGPITSYTVNYTPVNSGRRSENFTNATSLVIATLQPFTNYSVAVQACTDAGCGPFSDEIFVLTQQEGICREDILTLVLFLTNWIK